MLKKIKFVLPGISTIQAWLKIYNLKTGFHSKLYEKLKTDVKVMSKAEKECVIAFDELNLIVGLDYNTYHDMREGFQDFEDHRRSEVYCVTGSNLFVIFYLMDLLKVILLLIFCRRL